MNEEQVDQLLAELAQTRDAFSTAIGSVRWNKVNTIIQYCLLAILLFIGGLVYKNYRDDQHAACVSANEFRVTIVNAQQVYVENVARALAKKLGGDEADVRDFMEIYSQQPLPEVLKLREC